MGFVRSLVVLTLVASTALATTNASAQRHGGHGVRGTARAVGRGVRDGGRTVGRGVRDGTRQTGRAIRDAFRR